MLRRDELPDDDDDDEQGIAVDYEDELGISTSVSTSDSGTKPASSKPKRNSSPVV